MFTCLFWNLNRNPLHRTIGSLALKHDVDVIILAESRISVGDMLSSLNSNRAEYHYSAGECLKIEIYSRFPSTFIRPLHETQRLTIRRVTLPGRMELLLAALHHVDKRQWKAESQSDEMTRIAERIRHTEVRVGHSRTLLVGDLNMNPFEHGVAGARGLHAVMTRQLAERGQRTVQFRRVSVLLQPDVGSLWGCESRSAGDLLLF